MTSKQQPAHFAVLERIQGHVFDAIGSAKACQHPLTDIPQEADRFPRERIVRRANDITECIELLAMFELPAGVREAGWDRVVWWKIEDAIEKFPDAMFAKEEILKCYGANNPHRKT